MFTNLEWQIPFSEDYIIDLNFDTGKKLPNGPWG